MVAKIKKQYGQETSKITTPSK